MKKQFTILLLLVALQCHAQFWTGSYWTNYMTFNAGGASNLPSANLTGPVPASCLPLRLVAFGNIPNQSPGSGLVFFGGGNYGLNAGADYVSQTIPSGTVKRLSLKYKNFAAQSFVFGVLTNGIEDSRFRQTFTSSTGWNTNIFFDQVFVYETNQVAFFTTNCTGQITINCSLFMQ